MGLQQYQDNQEQLPPKLLTEGARVDPEWLRKFLSNPALSTTDTNRNGVRPYLKVRMPTFSFSDNELRKLVRFFQALVAAADALHSGAGSRADGKRRVTWRAACSPAPRRRA